MAKEMRMLQLRLATCVLALAALGGCGRHGSPAAGLGPADHAAAPASVAAVADPGEGPRITLSKDNVHLEYRVYGHGEPAVMLVHGWACDSNYWNAQIEPLKNRYTVVALNLAGHGGSENNRTDWSIANYAQDVATIAQQIPNTRIVLVGHGMGALVSLAATPLIGQRVVGVIAVDALRSVGLPTLTPREVAARVAPFREDFVGATRKLVPESLFPKGADALLTQKVAYDMSLEPPAIGVASLQQLLSMDLSPVLAQIHVPVYAINSDLQPTDAARIRRSLPRFTLDVLPGTGHFLMMEAPARFNPILLKDLDALAPHGA
jgi:pimeloyl-ACP methyl ester carboxylesterase